MLPRPNLRDKMHNCSRLSIDGYFMRRTGHGHMKSIIYYESMSNHDSIACDHHVDDFKMSLTIW